MTNLKKAALFTFEVIFSILFVGSAYYAHKRIIEINDFLDATFKE